MPAKAYPEDDTLRIGLFAHRPAQRQPTGLSRYLQELVPALARVADGRHALVVTSTREPDRISWMPADVQAHYVPWPRFAVQLAWCLGAGPRIERSLGRLDVTHLIQPFPPARSGSPQVVTVHDLFPFEHPEWYPRSELWTFRRSLAIELERARAVVVPSAWVAGRVAESFEIDPARIDVVPHGVSGTFTRPLSPDGVAATCRRFGLEPGEYLVCVGAVSARKNVRTLVRALADLPAPRYPLAIVGPDGEGSESVDAEIARHAPGAVVRTGFLPDEQTAALVQGAGALVHPALAEGFGLVPLEAMAVGTPVIAARSSSIPEVVGEAAVLVDDPTDPGAWASAIDAVVGDGRRRARLAAAGPERAARFSWDHAAETMLGIYAQVAAG